MTTAEQTEDPARWDDLFVREVDERPVQFVRPADTDRPVWAVYEAAVYVGSVTTEADGARPLWRVQGSCETHRDLDDAIRSLRRPPSWTREREQVAAWARRLLADETLLAIDVETTGLENAYAVQIAAVDRAGAVVFNEYVQPNAALEPAAVAVHGITPDRLDQAPAFAELLPRLTDVLHGRVAVAYKMDFDRGVVERELRRHHRGDAAAVDAWLGRVRWEDAMVPYAVWRGLWSVKRGAYRNQPLGGPHDAVADARLLIAKLEQMAATPPVSPW